MGRESYSKYQRRMFIARFAAEMARWPEERRTNSAAGRVIALWNARLARGGEPLMVPTIAAAIRAGRPVLTYQCPACQMIGDADVRRFDRHPHASLESLIPALSCPRCPDGPFVRLLGLR